MRDINVQGTDVTMVAVWAEQNDSNKYDIYYQKFAYNGDKVGETLLVRNQSDTHLTNLPTNEFTLNNSMPGDIFISTPHGMEDSFGMSISDGNITVRDKNTKKGLQYLKLDDGSYVTVWQETQDQSVIGIGHQRFDSEGNALASQLIRYDTPRQISGPTWVEDEITLEQKQVPALTIEKGQGLNDFTISLNSTNETFSVSDTPITTPSPMGAEAENLQIARY